MATVISGPVLSERRHWWRHVFLYLAVILLLALLGTVGSIYHMVRAPLPQLDGTIRVPGLSADVRVIRDGHGIPTIEAANLDDLFFAQGYVTAQDRLWQMDIMKRFAAGEIAEILGPDLLKHDREQRILGLRAAAKNALEKLPARELHFLDAYAKGVNAYMNSSRDHLPIEFRILKYTPQPWSAEDSLIMHARMVQDLNHGQYRAALQHEKILAKLGPQLTAELYVNSSWRDRPPSSASLRMEEDQRNGNNDQDEEEEEPMSDSPQAITRLLSGHKEAAGLSEWADEVKLIAGSNNWVVGGGHTITGKPLLSNDMHLGHQMPNLWYEAHLRCGDYDVAGVTLPGVPFVIVGHNQRIAWGFTNVGPTVEDLYVETFNEQGQYQTPAGW